MTILLATNNKGKVKEISDYFQDLDIKIIGLDEYPAIMLPVESGNSYEENAIIKARYVADITKMITLADDSGLEVDALGQRPGIYSSRFAGENASDYDNIKKLSDLMKDIPFQERSARFVCVIAIAIPDGKADTVRGICNGHIALKECGSSGFGYDPIFIPEGSDKRFSEITLAEKNKISHRANALKKIREYLTIDLKIGA